MLGNKEPLSPNTWKVGTLPWKKKQKRYEAELSMHSTNIRKNSIVKHIAMDFKADVFKIYPLKRVQMMNN